MRRGVAITQRRFDPRDFIGFLAERVGRQQEDPARTHRFGLLANRLVRGLPHRDPLGHRKSHLARRDVVHGFLLSGAYPCTLLRIMHRSRSTA